MGRITVPTGESGANGRVGDARVHIFARKRLVQNVRIFKQAESLARAGYVVTVIGVLADGSPAREQRHGFTIARVPVERLRHRGAGTRWWRVRPSPGARRLLRAIAFPLRWFAYYRGAYRLATGEFGRPDIVHCNDLDSLPVGLLVARRYHVPIVYDVQDLYPEQDHIPRSLRTLLALQERVLIRRVNRICAVNDAIAGVLTNTYGVTIDTVLLNCPPFYEGPNGRPGPPTLRDVLGIPEEQTLLVYSGALEPHRGLKNVVLSLRHLDDNVRLVLLGEGTMREQLERVSIDAGLGERVHFHGFVPHLEVPGFIRAADIGIVPYEHVGLNHYLCSPSKLFHYIMAELPIVCSDFPFLRQVVVGNEIGAAFDPSEAGSIASAIRAVIALRAGDEALQERLRSLKRQYCWEREEERLVGLYGSLPLNNGIRLGSSDHRR